MSERPESRVAILCPDAGIGRSSLRKRLSELCRVPVRDVEWVLCHELQTTREELKRVRATKPAPAALGEPWPTIQQITQLLPRRTVQRLWEEAFKKATFDLVAEIEKSDTPAPGVIIASVVYHSGRRSEYYSPCNARVAAGAFVDANGTCVGVVHAIDDIYDAYSRLAQPGKLFDAPKDFLEYLRILRDESGFSEPETAEPQHGPLYLGWLAERLNQLLFWRHTNTVVAEGLANTLDVPFLVWAIKQSPGALREWLDGAPSMYLSHAISKPRSEQRALAYEKRNEPLPATGHWPSSVHEFNSLQGLFETRGVACVMPTGIDEFRLGRFADAERQDKVGRGEAVPRRRVDLGDRWPTPAGNAALYLPPTGTDGPALKSILAPKKLVGGELVSYTVPVEDELALGDQLLGLELAIRPHVPARDHTLVACTNSLLVFRMFEHEKGMSRGVRAEVMHWGDLALVEEDRRIAFFHRVGDLRHIKRSQFDNNTRSLLVDVLVDITGAADGNEASRILERLEEEGDASLLDRSEHSGADIARWRQELPALRDDARLLAAVDLLCARALIKEVPADQVGVWILDDNAPTDSVVDEIAAFVRGENPAPLLDEDRLARLVSAAGL